MYVCTKRIWASQVAQVIKNPTANAGDVGLVPGAERSLEEEMATHSSILAWEIPWREKPCGLQSIIFQSQTPLSMGTHPHTDA